jgi:thiamine biosynthesis lipoprotein
VTATPLRTAAVTGEALGTTTRVVSTSPDALPALARLTADRLHGLDLAASRFRADSDLSRANAAAGCSVRVGRVLRDALTVALDMAAATGGLVDPTLGDVLAAAGYDRTFRLVPDGHGSLQPLTPARPTWADVVLYPDEHGAWLTVPRGCSLDLGATAKAWLADRVAAAGTAAASSDPARGPVGVLVDLGGDVSVAGPPPRHGWLVGLPHPDEGQAMVSIQSGGLATSAQDERAWRSADGPAHHIVDPRTGLPARTPWRCVTVHAATATEANAASTAAMVLGEDAPAWLQAQGLAARLVPMTGGGAVRVGPWPQPAASAARSSGSVAAPTEVPA